MTSPTADVDGSVCSVELTGALMNIAWPMRAKDASEAIGTAWVKLNPIRASTAVNPISTPGISAKIAS